MLEINQVFTQYTWTGGWGDDSVLWIHVVFTQDTWESWDTQTGGWGDDSVFLGIHLVHTQGYSGIMGYLDRRVGGMTLVFLGYTWSVLIHLVDNWVYLDRSWHYWT